LIVGLAALGVISMRTVEERHRVIGTLRALGFQRRWIQADLLLEAGFVALLGVGIGIAIGIVIAHSLVLFIGKQHPEVTFGVPVMNLVVIALVATGSALLATWWPALLAARVSPAASLRHE
jgi:putative ABC transport system permease protein